MRVSVSLSDRPTEADWRDSAACLQLDPAEFDDVGTPLAWHACRTCPVKAECHKDVTEHPDRTEGVYRAGKAWGVKRSAHYCVECGADMLRSIRKPLPPGWVRHKAKGMCGCCHSRHVNQRTRRLIPRAERLQTLSDLRAEGMTLASAAQVMGVQRATLVTYLRRAGRTA